MSDSLLLPSENGELKLPSPSFKRLKLSLNKNRNRIVQLDEPIIPSNESNLTVIDDAFIMGKTVVDENHVNTTSAIKMIGTPITSLKNLGNTCFLNSILYCLFYIHEYRKIVHGVSVQLQIKYSEKNKVKFPSSEETVVLKLHEIFCEMSNRIENQQVGTDPNLLEFDCKVLSPKKLLISLSTYNYSIFEGNCEKDALDALNCIVECLEGAKKKIKEKNEKKFGKKNNKNFEDFMFQGKLLMKTKCLECETCSESTENFSEIAIPTVSNILDFQNAIKMKETLRDDDKYDCHICYQKNEAIRRCEYLQFPPIFIINLKPGYMRKRSWDEVHKSCDICIVPERISCLSEHCQPQSCTNASHEFKLIAVITHIGASLMTGHFTTYIRGSVMNEKMDNTFASNIEHKHLTRNLCRKTSMIEKMSLNCCDPHPNVLLDNQWVFFDDEHVKVIPQLPNFGGSVSTERPYLLFYRNLKDNQANAK